MKKILSSLIALCMLVTMLSGMITVNAEVGTPATEVYYCGVKLDATNKYLLQTSSKTVAPVPLASNVTAVDGYELLAEFDAETGTLTYKTGFGDLTQWNTQMNMVQLEDGGIYYGIKANGDLTIELGDYKNFLYLPNNQPTDNALCGVDVAGDLTINGGIGMLKITAQPSHKVSELGQGLTSYGIRADGDITLNGGEVYIFTTANSDGVKTNYTTFIDAGENSIIVDGATVKLRSGYSANTPGAKRYNGTLVKGVGYTESNDTKVTISDSRGIEGTTEISWWSSNASLSLTPPTGAYKISIGKDAVQLGGVNKYLHATDKANFTANSTAEGAIAEYDSATETLKFLSDATLEYWDVANHPNAWLIVSDSNLTIDLNGKNISLRSMPNYAVGGAVNVSKDLTVKGNGKLDAQMRCVYLLATGEKGAVLKSGTKIKFEDVTANVYTTGDCGLGDVNRSGYVMDAPIVEFTESSNVRCATGTWQATGTNSPGRVFKNTNTITIPATADAFVGNMNTVTTGSVPPEDDTVKTYKSDLLASSTYFAVSTIDTTVSVDSMTEADGVVTFALSGDVPVCVLAASYDANGDVVDADLYSGTADGETRTLTVDNSDTVKVYIWDSVNEMNFIKKARIY